MVGWLIKQQQLRRLRQSTRQSSALHFAARELPRQRRRPLSDAHALQHFAHARLALACRATEKLQGQLDDILAFVGELKALDVSGVSATDVATEARNAWREDVPEPGLARDVALANAPLARHEQFAVPKVIE